VGVGEIHGEIVEINWRATRLRTNDNNYLIIPNSVIAKENIINFYAPDRHHALRVTIGVDCAAEPDLVKKVLKEAAQTVPGVSQEDKASVRITAFGDFSITYEVKFWLDDHAHYQEMNDGVRTAIWYALKKENIKIPFPVSEVHHVSGSVP
jgi:small-conductance mechanosensitive channel